MLHYTTYDVVAHGKSSSLKSQMFLTVNLWQFARSICQGRQKCHWNADPTLPPAKLHVRKK